MTQKPLYFLLLFLMPFSLKALDAQAGSLSAEDIASFMGIGHRVITFMPGENVQSITYFIDIYRDGKFLASVRHFVDGALNENNPNQRIVILFKEENRMVEMNIRGGKSGVGFEFEKPNGINGFPYSSNDVNFDEEGRLVLAFDLEKNEEGGTIFTKENTTLKGAKSALVLRIVMQ